MASKRLTITVYAVVAGLFLSLCIGAVRADSAVTVKGPWMQRHAETAVLKGWPHKVTQNEMTEVVKKTLRYALKRDRNVIAMRCYSLRYYAGLYACNGLSAWGGKPPDRKIKPRYRNMIVKVWEDGSSRFVLARRVKAQWPTVRAVVAWPPAPPPPVEVIL